MEETKTNSELEVLQREIKAAREAVIQKAESDTLIPVIKNKERMDASGQKNKEIPDDRFIRRFKKRRLKDLDALVAKFLRFRADQDDTEGEIVVQKFDEYDQHWKKLAEVHNKKKTNTFTLRFSAFKERVEYMLNVEKQQIAAAKEQYNHSLCNKWWAINYKKYWLLKILWQFISLFKRMSVEDLKYNWYNKHIKNGKEQKKEVSNYHN